MNGTVLLVLVVLGAADASNVDWVAPEAGEGHVADVCQADSSTCPGEEDAIPRAMCLRDLAFERFGEFAERWAGYSVTEPRFVEGLALVDESIALLDGAGANEELARLLIDTAATIPHVFVTGGETPMQTEVLELCDRYLIRSIELFRELTEAEWELGALRELSRKTEGQLKRIVLLAVTVEGPHSPRLALDVERLANWYTSRDIREAIRLYEWVVDIYRHVPSAREELADELHNLGWQYFRVADLHRARSYYEEALQLYEELGRDDGIPRMALYLGGIALEHGDLTRAGDYFGLALVRHDSPRDFSEARLGLALLLFLEGDRIGATEMLTSPPEHFWHIIATDFHRFFTEPTATRLKEASMEMFREAGIPDAEEAIRAHWPETSR